MTQDELLQRVLFVMRDHMPPQPEPEFDDEAEEVNLYTMFREVGMDDTAVDALRLDLSKAFDVSIPEDRYLGVFEMFKALCALLPEDEEEDF